MSKLEPDIAYPQQTNGIYSPSGFLETGIPGPLSSTTTVSSVILTLTELHPSKLVFIAMSTELSMISLIIFKSPGTHFTEVF